MNKKPTFRRLLAYVIDVVLVSFIVTAFSYVKFLNPKFEDYNKYSSEYNTYIQEVSRENPTAILSDEKAIDLSYKVAYYGVYTSIITLVVTFLYFGVFQYYTGGKTLGKLMLGIEVVSTDDKKLKLSQTIIRSAIINSLLTSSLTIILLLFLSKNSFLTMSKVVEFIDLGLILVCVAMIIYREDGVGLHDKLAHTMVVFRQRSVKSEIKEAVVTEKKTTKRTKKEE